MADSGEGSRKRKVVLRVERYRRKPVPYFEDKSMVDVYAELRFDIGGLVQRECSAEFEFWKKVPEELKKSMLWELLRKYLDELFRKHFQQWKFDVLRDAEQGAATPKEED
ncbi:hypothetical protein C1H46_041550 [Malus baccata]|uniref:Uncharacterized protein n=1 Tax=Malus baccata TaxID=106549 RepID=A0A540KFA8_MALBA|nr:hypothetical protein C1H46_041550 [Malus baccata]